MRISLKARVIILLVILTLIPVVLYFYYNSVMREKILEDRLRFHSLYASSVVSRVELFLERMMSEASSLVYLYRNFGWSEEEIIWRVSGHIKGIFEGAFYSPEGILMVWESRESSTPNFEKFLRIDESKEVLGIEFTQYKEPFLRFVVPDVESGLLKGYFVFSLDLSLFWQSVMAAKPTPSVEVFLTDGEGNILAFSDMRFSERERLPYRKGIYRSSVTGVEVVGVYAKSEDGKWAVFVEEPISVVLQPLYSFQQKAMIGGSLFMVSAGVFAIFVFLRIFKPLENLKNYVISWEEENIKKPIRAGDEVSELSQAFENLIRRLQEERKLYFALFENTLDGIIVFDHTKRVVDINRTVSEQFHIRREEFVGTPMEEILGEELPVKSLFFSEKKLRFGGKEVFCQLRQEVLRIEGKLYLMWRIRDLSQEKELKVLLEQTSKLSLAGEIACSIAHQINNPLASIMGYAESIQLTTSEDRTRRKAEIIQKHAQKCAETVRKLMEIGKPFEGKPSYVKPEELTIDAISMVAPKAKRKNVGIEFENSLNGERLFTFPWQVEQVLINVIDNAVDASPPGGKVKISLGKEEGKVVWKVSDSGEGIRKEDIDKVFTPFYTTKPYGTGLGLPLAKRLVKNLGGDIRIKSFPGKGTTVEIRVGGLRDESSCS